MSKRTTKATAKHLTPPAPTDAYLSFLESKRIHVEPAGFGVDADTLNPRLFPFQRAVVRWALQQGRAALFAGCGLGKSGMSLEWAKHVAIKTGKPVLILAPLAVAQQFVEEGDKFGVPCRYVQDGAAVTDAGVYTTNYDRVEKFDAATFGGVVLDESSILKAFSGVMKNRLLDMWARTPYRLCGTATPAPNDHQELGNHAEFLGIMRSDLMLSRWFVNDTSAAGVWRLKGHAAADFWRWVTSWAVCAEKPSDLGDFADDGYNLPALHMVQHTVEVDVSDPEGGRLFRDATLSATTMHAEMRRTVEARADRVAQVVANTDAAEPWVIWCHTNYEADALLARIPGAAEVRGDMSQDEKERRVSDFVHGRSRILVSKPSILGFGLNFQHCAHMAFVGLSYSFESFYQAMRRTWRFGQTREVTAHIVAAETEGDLTATLRRKTGQHEAMLREMVAAMCEHGLDLRHRMTTAIDFEKAEAHGRGWEMRLGDSCDRIREIPDGSVDMSIFSPPFSTLYVYSDSYRDMGNNATDDQFFAHYKFLVGELLRITKPGRLCVVHCKQLVNYKGRDGQAGLRDFRGDLIRAHQAAGWVYHSEVCIWTDPVLEMQRTKSHGLLYKQIRRDSSYSRQGLAEYLLVFRKWSDEGDVSPVTHTADDFPLDTWQRYASPVWMDIKRTDVLNVEMARENKDEKHIAPLQLEVIRRAVDLWTNRGDLVFSPFGGIGSEGVGSLQMGRRFLGCELKRSYWEAAQRHLRGAESQSKQVDMFAADEATL